MFVPCERGGGSAGSDFKGFTLLMVTLTPFIEGFAAWDDSAREVMADQLTRHRKPIPALFFGNNSLVKTNPFVMTASVSVGNVGQLAIDLVISTFSMTKVGYFYTDCLVPMVGNNPYATAEENSTELSINAEVYSLPSKKLVVLQIRSPFIKNKYRPFCQTLLSWVESSNCARVVLLSSSHAYQRNDEQLLGTPLRYLLTPDLEKAVGGLMQELNWKEMEKVAAYPGINDAEKVLHIPGGGITKLLFTESCSKGIQMAVLLKFCSEGDNIPDAFALVNYLNEWLQLIKCEGNNSTDSSSQWKIPSSWRLLFGSGLPPALF